MDGQPDIDKIALPLEKIVKNCGIAKFVENLNTHLNRNPE